MFRKKKGLAALSPPKIGLESKMVQVLKEIQHIGKEIKKKEKILLRLGNESHINSNPRSFETVLDRTNVRHQKLQVWGEMIDQIAALIPLLDKLEKMTKTNKPTNLLSKLPSAAELRTELAEQQMRFQEARGMLSTFGTEPG